MRFVVLTILLVIFKLASAQRGTDTNAYNIETIQGSRVKTYIDSLKNRVLSDTTLYKRSDLIHTLIGTRNSKHYSKLFIVNAKYYYKLDIIENKDVVDFANYILNPEIIDSIYLFPATYCGIMFGENLPNGACYIFINVKPKSYFKISGLARHRKRFNNFYQRREGELLVHD